MARVKSPTKLEMFAAEAREAQRSFTFRGESLAGYLSFYVGSSYSDAQIQAIFEADKAWCEKLAERLVKRQARGR
jgi:hypothetical protein